MSVWVARLPACRCGLPSRGAADPGGDRGRRHAVRRRDDRSRCCWPTPTRSRSTAFVEQAGDALPGLPLVAATPPACAAPARPGCSSTVCCTTGVRSAGARRPARPPRLVSQGCRPVGPTMTVTAAEGNLLLGLAGIPAVTEARGAARRPRRRRTRPWSAAVCTSGSRWTSTPTSTAPGDFLVRGVLGVDSERGGLVVGDVVAVGQTVQLQVRDAETADDDLTELLLRERAVGASRVRCCSPATAAAALFGGRPRRRRGPGRARCRRRRRLLRGRRDRSGRRPQPPARLHRPRVLGFPLLDGRRGRTDRTGTLPAERLAFLPR